MAAFVAKQMVGNKLSAVKGKLTISLPCITHSKNPMPSLGRATYSEGPRPAHILGYESVKNYKPFINKPASARGFGHSFTG